MPKLNPLDHPIALLHPRRLHPTTAWAGHVPFAFFLMDVLRPEVVVELGTYTGVSYCAFCQAVEELELTTKCYAVDTWRGEETKSMGPFAPEVLTDLRLHHDAHYRGFSHLLQSTFDDALVRFNDGTIDLLHIDGEHSYGSVKHDFETWLPKMSDRGIVLFHDTNVRMEGFGVWRFWEELKPLYPHFEFMHEHGLGVLATGSDIVPALRQLFDSRPTHATIWQKIFHRLGQRLTVGIERETEKTHLFAQLKHTDLQLGTLWGQLQAKEHDLQRHAAELRLSSAELERVCGELSSVDGRLQDILNSRAWRWVSRYGRAKNRLLRIFHPQAH